MITEFFSPIRTHPFAYPVLEIIHILGIALLVGNLILLEVRVWGRGQDLPIQSVARLSLTLALIGFTLASFSGLLMFAAQAADLLANRAFVIKMLLLVCAACNAAWFHGRGSLTLLDGIAKLQVTISMLIWIGVITAGRWIAYW